MEIIEISDPTPPKKGEITYLKAKEGKMSLSNREVELNGRDLIAKIVTVKALCLVSYARRPIENLNAHRRRKKLKHS